MACQNEATDTTTDTETIDLKTALQGTWQTYQINAAINSADGRDTFRSENLTQEVWEQVFQMEPPVYYFQADQKFRKIHRTLAGETMSEKKGMWNIFGDTLMLIQPDTTLQFIIRLKDGRASFRHYADWDDDGIVDDEVQELQRQISIGTE